MATAIELNLTATGGGQITADHFGLNFVADYERIGTKPWEKFDDIVAKLDLDNLRYPGGTAAETVFDYRNPNRTTFVDANGETGSIAPISLYLEYCNQAKINPTVILPTSVLISSNVSGSHRTFDQSQADDIAYFIEYVMAQVDPSLTLSFELGNEYETYMSSTEYGRVANALTEIITEVAHMRPESSEATVSDSAPKIFVQAWAYSVGGGTSIGELTSRNQQVISEFDQENLNEIDGIVSHYYFSEGRNAGTDQEQTFGEISDQIDRIADLHEAWTQACDRDLISRISEWNVLFRANTDLGLQQVSPLMEMFTNFLASGVDALDFWSAQYHATSIADKNGRLMAAGALFDILKPNLLGTGFGEANHSGSLSSYTFVGEGRYVAVLTSEQAASLVIGFESSGMPPGFHMVDGYVIGVDETTSDGKYRELVGLPAYGEPDATITVTQIPMTLVTGVQSFLSLGSFESVVIVFTLDQPSREISFGTDYADLLYGTGVSTQFIGGKGVDTVSYAPSTKGVLADLGVSSDASGTYGGDLFVSIETLLGSSYNDTLRGSVDGDLLDGWGGDDVLFGRDGNDKLSGGSGHDTLYGGSGADVLRGGAGNDVLIAGGGADSLFGDDGLDTISFADHGSSVSIWVPEGVVEIEGGRVSFSGIERFIGSLFDDVFSLGASASEVDGLAGDDQFRMNVGGSHTISGGDGNDNFYLSDGEATVFGGSGADTVFSQSSGTVFEGGQGRDRFYAFGNNNLIEGQEDDDFLFGGLGEDTFVFSSTSDHDEVFNFRVWQDSIAVRGISIDDVWMIQTDLGSQIFFGQDSSVLLSGAFLDDLSSVSFVFL